MIEQNLYNKILTNIPIICVDGVILSKNGVLFMKRKNEPAKNEWWFPGGRLLKNESLEDAIIRKVKEETHIDVKLIKSIGVSQTIFETGVFGIPTHTINFTFLLTTEDFDVKIDKDHIQYIWTFDFDSLNLNSEILKLLKNNNINDKCFY